MGFGRVGNTIACHLAVTKVEHLGADSCAGRVCTDISTVG